MYRRILAPVDGSDASMLGLAQAIGLARDQRARLRILNVVDDMMIAPVLFEPMAAADITAVLDGLRAEGEKALAEAGALARKRGVAAEAVQVEGGARRVSDAILEDARRWGADLIVMGTHGRRGFNRMVLGSDAERVLHETPVPVLLARLIPAPKRPRRRTK